MKKILPALTLLHSLAYCDVKAKDINPSKDSLQQKLVQFFSKEGNGKISTIEALAIKTLYYAAQEKGLFDSAAAAQNIDSLMIHCIKNHTYPDTMEVLLQHRQSIID